MPEEEITEVPEQHPEQETKDSTPEATSEQEGTSQVSEEKPAEEKSTEATEEAKKETPEKKEEKVLEERVYTFRLGRIYSTTRKKRAPRAVKYIKSRLERHLKKPVKISPEVNSIIWSRGAEKPVRKITVKTLIYEDRVLVVPMR